MLCSHQEAPAEAAALERAPGKKKKRKKLRINADAPATQRTVFDADGEPLDPLASLGLPEQGQAGHTSASDRFAAVHARLQEQDGADLAHAREQRQAARALKKAKQRASGVADAMQVQLGGAASDSEGEIDEHASGADRAEHVVQNGAYVGMQPASGDDKSAERGIKRSSRAAGLDVEAQEALAKRLLAARGL